MLLGSNGFRTALVACAVVLSCSRPYTVGTSTSAGGARVAIDSGRWMRLPCAVELSDLNIHPVRIALFGYEEHVILIEREAGRWRLDGIQFEEGICLAVTVTAGEVYMLTPEQFTAAFRREPIMPAPKRDWLLVMAAVTADSA